MNGVNYAIAMDYVVETEKAYASDIKTAAHKPFIRMRGELVPLLFEPVLLGRSEPDGDEVCLVVVQNQNQKFGLVVDEFVGQLDVVQKPLSGAFADHPFLTGTSLLGNGEVLFVLDPRRLTKAD
jgi:two-component system chemotaxis sensor kinase CheA